MDRIPGELSLSDFYGTDMRLANKLLAGRKPPVMVTLVWYIALEAKKIRSGSFTIPLPEKKE